MKLPTLALDTGPERNPKRFAVSSPLCAKRCPSSIWVMRHFTFALIVVVGDGNLALFMKLEMAADGEVCSSVAELDYSGVKADCVQNLQNHTTKFCRKS